MAGITRCQTELQSENNSVGPLTVDELQTTEKAIVARVQWNVYPQEMKLLSSCNSGDANLTVVQSTHCYDKTCLLFPHFCSELVGDFAVHKWSLIQSTRLFFLRMSTF